MEKLEAEEVERKPMEVLRPIKRLLLKCKCGSKYFRVRIEHQVTETQTRRWFYLICPECNNEYQVELPYGFIDRHFEEYANES